MGDDFTYSNDAEWDQQYSNYNQIMAYINSNYYNAQIQWGTLSDYFTAVHTRMTKFDDLVGDFFVYSDVFSEGTKHKVQGGTVKSGIYIKFSA